MPPVYDFTSQPRKENSAGMAYEPNPSIPQHIPGHPDLSKKTTITQDPTNTEIQTDVRSILPKGFHAIDEGIKKYFTGIIIPTKDNQREMIVRIAGGDKTFLFWKQDLQANRIALPVMSINRTGFKWDEKRYSPPYMHMTKRFAASDGSRLALVYRPWPCMVDYTFTIWAERKRDIEYATYQIVTRFNPMAELMVEFETLKGNIRGLMSNVSNSSDIDIGAEELAKVRYDFTTSWEAWLPLPEKIMPSILGKVGVLLEDTGAILDVAEFSERGGLNTVVLVDNDNQSSEEE